MEGAGRWHQAEEVYKLGLEKEARPAERLMRKFGDFERRMAASATDPAEPCSPALPTVRPALASKADPFASAAPNPDFNPQANPRHGTGSAPKKSKMEIFSDAGSAVSVAAGTAATGWATIGTRTDRRKENTITAQPWTGEKLETGAKTNSGMGKLMVFKDEVSLSWPNRSPTNSPKSHNHAVELMVPDVSVHSVRTNEIHLLGCVECRPSRP